MIELKRAIGLAILPVMLVGASVAFANQNPLIGNWARNDGTTRIAISTCGTSLCAVNTWVKDPDGKEKVGDKLILTLQPESGSKFDGQAYDVRRQAHYKMTITLQGDKAMQTSGCVLLGVVCKSTGWTRTN